MKTGRIGQDRQDSTRSKSLEQFQARQVLRIDNTDGSGIIVHHHQIIDSVLFEQVQNFHRKTVAMHGDRVERHQVRDQTLAHARVVLKMADEIAVRKDSQQTPRFIGDDGRTRAQGGHLFEDGMDVRGRLDQGKGIVRAHDLVNAKKQASADHARGMKAREIFFLEAARLKQNHCQGVAQSEHDGSAGSRGEIQRTGFLFDIGIEHDVRVLRERRVRIATKSDDLDVETPDRWKNAQQFFGLAARAQSENHIAVRNHAKIAMERVERIEHDRGRTGAGEGGSDLRADVPGFADAQNHDFAARLERRFDQIDRMPESFIEPIAQPLELENFEIEDASSLPKVIHPAITVGRGRTRGKVLRPVCELP